MTGYGSYQGQDSRNLDDISDESPLVHEGLRKKKLSSYVPLILCLCGAVVLSLNYRAPQNSSSLNFLSSNTDSSDDDDGTDTSGDDATNKLAKVGHIDPSDGNATFRTKLLLKSLRDLMHTDAIAFGHHYDNFAGQYWWAPDNITSSDVHNATGDYPALFGYDIYDLLNGNGKNWSDYAWWSHSKTGVIVLSWWAENPVSLGEAHDCDGSPVKEILPGGSAHELWKEWLDQIVHFLIHFKDEAGEQIPVVFRLFREPNTDHWWWGKRCASPDEYTRAYDFTYNYIQSRTHNILWCYSPCQVADDPHSALVTWYPGDDKIDIIGADRYATSAAKLVTNMNDDCNHLQNFTTHHTKVVSFAEMGILDGIQDITDVDFFSLLFDGEANDCLMNLSYASMWANYSPEKYWTPLPGETTANSFKAFAESSRSVFLSDDRWQAMEYPSAISGGTYSDKTSSATQGSNGKKTGDSGIKKHKGSHDGDDDGASLNKS